MIIAKKSNRQQITYDLLKQFKNSRIDLLSFVLSYLIVNQVKHLVENVPPWLHLNLIWLKQDQPIYKR